MNGFHDDNKRQLTEENAVLRARVAELAEEAAALRARVKELEALIADVCGALGAPPGEATAKCTHDGIHHRYDDGVEVCASCYAVTSGGVRRETERRCIDCLRPQGTCGCLR